MRTKNARAIDADEAAWMADVKSVPCVFCDKPAPVEAHHVRQGRHFGTVATCDVCHAVKAWLVGKLTEFDAVNETIRRVIRYRAGSQQKAMPSFRKPRAQPSRGTALTSPKIVPRPYI